MYEIINKEWKNHILFRDYLRNHAKEAKEYAALKYDLMWKLGNDREKYTEAKAEFINNILKQAKKKITNKRSNRNNLTFEELSFSDMTKLSETLSIFPGENTGCIKNILSKLKRVGSLATFSADDSHQECCMVS